MLIGPLLTRMSPLILAVGLYIVAGMLLRLDLWWMFGRDGEVEWMALGWILSVGLLLYAIQAVYLLTPLTALLWWLPAGVRPDRFAARLLFGLVAMFVSFVLFLSVVEHFFFAEFDSRFNLVSFDYLAYPTEVVGDIWAEYPVVPAFLAALVAGFTSAFVIRRRLVASLLAPAGWGQRSVFAAVWGILVIALGYAFQPEALAISDNRVANELAGNGISSFFRAMRTSEIDYATYYPTADRTVNFERVREALGTGDGEFTRLPENRLDRRFPARPEGLGRLNVIVVVCESFGAEFSKLYGSERDWTPSFDRYAQQGMWFSRAYASGTRTVRGLEAIATSLPPIPSVSVLRRPNNEGMANWGSVMRKLGYHTSFLYGGYGYFDNMNYFFSHNGFEVLDRNQIPHPVRFENIWGVSDEDLYRTAMVHFDRLAATHQPFFSIVMNTSNHKPFTFRPGLESYGIEATGGGRASGVRYEDFALDYLLSQSAKRSWFRDTLFVVLADHGARVYGREQIPLKTYEIPMMVYSPAHVAPGRVDTLFTQLDVAPTVLGLLGLAYEAPFFGQDVLHTPDSGRIAYVSHNHDVAILRDDRLSILGLHGRVRTLAYDSDTDTYRKLPPDTSLNALAIAVYQTATEMFHDGRYRSDR